MYVTQFVVFKSGGLCTKRSTFPTLFTSYRYKWAQIKAESWFIWNPVCCSTEPKQQKLPKNVQINEDCTVGAATDFGLHSRRFACGSVSRRIWEHFPCNPSGWLTKRLSGELPYSRGRHQGQWHHTESLISPKQCLSLQGQAEMTLGLPSLACNASQVSTQVLISHMQRLVTAESKASATLDAELKVLSFKDEASRISGCGCSTQQCKKATCHNGKSEYVTAMPSHWPVFRLYSVLGHSGSVCHCWCGFSSSFFLFLFLLCLSTALELNDTNSFLLSNHLQI